MVSFHNRNQITKDERVALHNLAGADSDGSTKDGSSKDEGVELAVFAARIDTRRQVCEKRGVQLASGKRPVELLRIDADGDAAKAVGNEARGQLTRVDAPERKSCVHLELGKVLFTIGPQIAQENVAEGDMAYSACPEAEASLRHPGFVKGIGTLGRYADFGQRQADGVCLQTQKLPANAMHADALKTLGDGSQKRGHSKPRIREKSVQSHGTVLSSAPGEYQRRGHGSVASGKLIAKPNPRIASERGIAEGQLIAFVEEIRCFRVDRKTAIEDVAGGEIKTGIARVARVTKAQEITVGGLANEKAGEGGGELPVGTREGDGARIRGATNQAIPRDERRIERVG